MTYEDIDDDLYDLLRRLLTKDPRKRISLEEVRHHPWLVADLPNKVKWLEENDTDRQTDGKKIEVSKEDLNTAVVPLQWVERVRSGIKKVGERLGISATTTHRGRSGSGVPSNVSHTASQPPSADSSSSTISQDARRHSLRGDEIFTALRASRDGDHPLSKSLAASPALEQSTEAYFDESDSLPSSDFGAPLIQSRSHGPLHSSANDRSKLVPPPAAGSPRTIKQSDFQDDIRAETPLSSPGLPGTPRALDNHAGSHFGNLFSGSGRSIFKSIRERSSARSLSSQSRSRSTDRDSVDSYDAHGEPSLALSQTLAAGRVDTPDLLMAKSSTPVDKATPLRPRSVMFPPGYRPSGVRPLSRHSSSGSITSAKAYAPPQIRAQPSGPALTKLPAAFLAQEPSQVDEERIHSVTSERRDTGARPPAASDERICPSSPDDTRHKQAFDSRRVSAYDISQGVPSYDTSPTGHSAQMLPSLVSSSSDFGSAVSMSISNPSIPSVISEASSIDPSEGFSIEELEAKNNGIGSVTASLNPRPQLREDALDDGYNPDHDTALDSDAEDDYDSDTDSDGGLVMSRRKSSGRAMLSTSPRNVGLTAALEAAQGRHRRSTGRLSRGSKKSSRSGSNNTMKKVRTRDSLDERRRESLEINEE